MLVATDVANLNAVVADQIGFSPYRPQLALAVLAVLVLLRRRAWRVPLGHAVVPGAAGALRRLRHQPAGRGRSGPAQPPAGGTPTRRSLLPGRHLALMQATHSVRRAAAAVFWCWPPSRASPSVHEFVLGNQGDLLGLSRVPLVREGGAFTARHAGTSSDVNFWARILILIAPLGLSLWASAAPAEPAGSGPAASPPWSWGCTSRSRGVAFWRFSRPSWSGFPGRGRYRRSLWLPRRGHGHHRADLRHRQPAEHADRRGLRFGRQLGSLGGDTQAAAGRRPQDVRRLAGQRARYRHLRHDLPRYDRLSDYSNPVDIVVAAHNFYLEQAADGGVVLLLAWEPSPSLSSGVSSARTAGPTPRPGSWRSGCSPR